MSGILVNKRYFIVPDKTAILESDSNKSAVCVMCLEMAYFLLPPRIYCKILHFYSTLYSSPYHPRYTLFIFFAHVFFFFFFEDAKLKHCFRHWFRLLRMLLLNYSTAAFQNLRSIFIRLSGLIKYTNLWGSLRKAMKRTDISMIFFLFFMD